MSRSHILNHMPLKIEDLGLLLDLHCGHQWMQADLYQSRRGGALSPVIRASASPIVQGLSPCLSHGIELLEITSKTGSK